MVNQEIKNKFESYPSDARKKLQAIRKLIFDIAEAESLGVITEQLKWGEPSYSSKFGSPIRIDWKPKYPDQVSIFVNCKTVLIETYKEIYGSELQYVGNREIVIPLSKPIPLPELEGCISMALQYHKLKKLPLLGA
ncbi:DUF1801 domain-containing protein [Alteromonas sp. MCA-1]|jgi:hypothetical protein|uniref:DUF1801 domain-containing protein n=1 Tax=Alteromonas sp. MCA-1 TaxID=2917731 RepID=UPI002342C5A0|nr:DUF1801 domain-containing protein [Alteromonas sp. MCA-1]